jgi:nucleotide-binding universal stress UspA family protein
VPGIELEDTMTIPNEPRPIVVGVDSTPSSRVALAWAADEALRRRLPLRVVHALDWPAGAYQSPDDQRPWQTWASVFRAGGERILEDARAFAAGRHPEVAVSAWLVDGAPAQALRGQAGEAAMVVLGSRRLSSVRELLTTGSVAVPVSAHSPCPVAVVREFEHAMEQPAFVVVGVDGSKSSETALEFAFEEASRRGAALVAVYAWRPSALQAGIASVRHEEPGAEAGHRLLLAESLAGWREKYPDVELRRELVPGHPVHVLSEASRHALALVVGSRGRGGFAGMLLGSVSQGVIHHAQCPVIVVPRPED